MSTVQDVSDRLRRLFGDESSVQLEDDDIIRWVNDAQREIVMTSETLLATTSTEDLVDGTNEYDLPTFLLVLRSLRVKQSGADSYTSLKFHSLVDFDTYVDGWDGTARGEGRPAIYTTYSGKLFLFPTPNADVTDGIKFLYSRKPTDVDELSDNLDLPDSYLNAIVTYCLGQATIMDEDYQAATIHQAKFTEDINKQNFREQPRVLEKYPVISVLPDDAW